MSFFFAARLKSDKNANTYIFCEINLHANKNSLTFRWVLVENKFAFFDTSVYKRDLFIQLELFIK